MRAGPWLDSLDVRLELEPVVAQLAGHQVCVTHYTLRDPAGSWRCSIGSISSSLSTIAELTDVARVCALADDLACATFDEVPWQAMRSLARCEPLATWWLPDPGPLSTLRTLATLASLLVDEGRGGLRPLDYLLARPAWVLRGRVR